MEIETKSRKITRGHFLFHCFFQTYLMNWPYWKLTSTTELWNEFWTVFIQFRCTSINREISNFRTGFGICFIQFSCKCIYLEISDWTLSYCSINMRTWLIWFSLKWVQLFGFKAENSVSDCNYQIVSLRVRCHKLCKKRREYNLLLLNKTGK